LKGFTSQFSSLEEYKARLQEKVLSTTSKLDQAVTMFAIAHQNAYSLKNELDQLKKKLTEEEKEKAEAQVRRKEREDLLHKSTLALLGKFTALYLNPFYLTSLGFNFRFLFSA
jgi:predicted Holliday junction resolvase-like endonuclease